MDPETDSPKAAAILLGEEEHEVTFRNKSKTAVRVRTIAIREIEKFLKLVEKEPELVEFLCRQKPNWADNLTPESHELLLARGLALNRPICERYAARRVGTVDWAVQQASGIAERVKALTSPISAPTAPSPSASPSEPSPG